MAVKKRTQYMGFCKEPGCDWEGPIRSTEQQAREDTDDHAAYEHDDETDVTTRVKKV